MPELNDQSLVSWRLRAVETVRGLMPIFGALYFFLFVKGNPASRDHAEVTRRSVSQTVVSWLMLFVLFSYVFDSVALLYLSFPQNVLVLEDRIVFALGSIFLWFIFFLDFLERRASAWCSLATCSTIYLSTETFLLLFSSPLRNLDRQLTICLNSFQLLRGGILIILLGIAIGYHVIPTRCMCCDDEEATPLLRDGNNYSNNRPGRPNASHYYGSMAWDQGSIPEDERVGRESASTIGNIKFLAPFFWPKDKPFLRLRFVGVGICLAVERTLNVLVPLLLARTTNTLVESQGVVPWSEILPFIILTFLDSNGGIPVLRKWLWLPIEHNSYRSISNSAYGRTMALSNEFRYRRDPSNSWELVNKGLSAVYIIRPVLFQIIPIAVDLFIAVSILFYMFNAYVAWIIALAVAIFFYSSSKTISKLQDKQAQLIADMEKEHNVLCDSISNWQTASYFNRLAYEKGRYSNAVGDHLNSSRRFFLSSYLGSVSHSFLFALTLMCTCSIAAYQIVRGDRPVGSFVMLFSYCLRLSSNLQSFAKGVCDLAGRKANSDVLITLLSTHIGPHNRNRVQRLRVTRGMVEFRDVGFAYDAQKRILNGITFQALAGQIVAIVGETGGGKSTMLSLLLGLHEPSQGSIAIDGQDVRDVTMESLHASIGVVSQDATLFHDTIMNNIRYANFSATDEQIYDACRAVSLHDKFKSFANGYQTLVGGPGVKLSGGEVQRVAIARAMIKNSKIVILDEATSSVDSYTESLVRRGLRKLCAGKTTFIIAHRLSTIVKADKILALHHGRIVEQGTHSSLLAENGYYAHLWSRQIRMKPLHPTSDETPLPQQDSAAGKKSDKNEDMSGLAVAGHPSSPLSVAPVLKVGKLRRRKSQKRDMSLDKRGLEEGHSDNKRQKQNPGGALSLRNVWKPDAPEFIPFSQRHPAKHQALVEGEFADIQHPSAAKNSQAYGHFEEGNVSGTSQAMAQTENAMRPTGNNENYNPRLVSGAKHTWARRNNSNKRITSVLQQTANGVVMAYPKKAKKGKGSRKRPALRRKRTESEPAGIGLNPESRGV